MNRKRIQILILALLALLLLGSAGAAYASSPQELSWWVIGGGGAPSSGGTVSLDGTLGQPVAGPSNTVDNDLHAGYWFDGILGYYLRLFLPSVIK